MKYFWLASCVLSLLFTSATFAAEKRPNLKNLDKPIELRAGDNPRMYVVFNHSTHKKVTCRNCHHEGLPGNRYAACTSPECHAITAPSSREPLSVYMAYHAPGMQRSCFGCHKPLAGQYPNFKGCKPCHESMGGKRVREAMQAKK